MKDLTIKNDHENGCNGCSSKECGICTSALPGTESHLFTRRNFGRTLLAASAGAILARCTKSPAPAGEAAVRQIQPLLDCRPILLLSRNRKADLYGARRILQNGPGPSSSHTMDPCGLPTTFSSGFPNFRRST